MICYMRRCVLRVCLCIDYSSADCVFVQVRELLCNAVDQFADLAGVVMMEEKERRGEGDDD